MKTFHQIHTILLIQIKMRHLVGVKGIVYDKVLYSWATLYISEGVAKHQLSYLIMLKTSLKNSWTHILIQITSKI